MPGWWEIAVSLGGLGLAFLGVALGFYTILVNGKANREAHLEMSQILREIAQSGERQQRMLEHQGEMLERVQESNRAIQQSFQLLSRQVAQEGERTREEIRGQRA